MSKKEKEKKLVIIKYAGPIPELGHICGPVLHPCPVELDSVVKLVTNNRRVFEVNPENRDEMVELSLKNVRLNNFPKGAATNVVPEEKTEVKEPPKPVNTFGNDKKDEEKESIIVTDIDDKKDESKIEVKTGKSDFKNSKNK